MVYFHTRREDDVENIKVLVKVRFGLLWVFPSCLSLTISFLLFRLHVCSSLIMV